VNVHDAIRLATIVAFIAGLLAALFLGGNPGDDKPLTEEEWFTDLDDANATRTGHVEIPPAELPGGVL
jgi:hypothetical protein